MNHLKWMGHSATILDIHKNLRSDLESCEVTLIAKGHTVKAHRFVLSSCSDLLRILLSDVPLGQECTVMVPDIKGPLLDSVLAFIYMGETCISSSNLSEFLEAINVLGIKSAISFECNTNALQNASPTTLNTIANGGSPSAAQTVSDCAVTGDTLTLTSADIIAHDNLMAPKLGSSHIIATNSRELELLDVYQEGAHHKITYSIEHIPGADSGSEFILTENSGTFTITQNPKIESTSSTASGQMDVSEEDDADTVEAHIIEEYNSTEDPLLQLTENANENATEVNVTQTQTTDSSTPLFHAKPTKSRYLKFKPQGGATNVQKFEQNLNSVMDTTESGSDDQLGSSTLHISNESCDMDKDNKDISNEISTVNESNSNSKYFTASTTNTSSLSATDLAYQAMVNDNLSLPKAAVKFNVSKTELWRRVRNTGVDTYITSEAQAKPSRQEEAIDLACQAVISEGYSLQKAAVKYDISKTVLWRRVRKHPDYMKTVRENPVITKAYERLKTGESLKSISRDLDIPMSTLHRHKVRLSQQGQLPHFVTCKRRDISKDDLKIKLAKAVHACVHEGMSQNHAANLYEISKSTLWRHLQKRVAEAESADVAELQSMESMVDDDEVKDEVILS